MITPWLFDQNLLLALNFDGGEVLDWVMYVVSGKLTWAPLYLGVLWLVFRRWGWRTALWFLVVAVVMVVCADQTASFFKNHVPKLRPTHYPPLEGMVHTVNGYLGGLYGTVSGHAANSFGFALLSALVLRRRWFWWTIFGWAMLVSYSRVYLGVHYPMDILFGTLTGLFFGALTYILYRVGIRCCPALVKLKK